MALILWWILSHASRSLQTSAQLFQMHKNPVFLFIVCFCTFYDLNFQHDSQLNSHHPSYLHSLLQMCGAAEDRPLHCNVSRGSAVQNRWKWTLPRSVHAWQVKITYACALPSVTTSVQVFYFVFFHFFITADGNRHTGWIKLLIQMC